MTRSDRNRHEPEYELDFVRYQETGVDQVIPKADRSVSKRDLKVMAKAASKEGRRRGKG